MSNQVSTNTTSPSGEYLINLDVLRLLTFIVVFFNHVLPQSGAPVYNRALYHLKVISPLGLDFFSVLSSFLITMVILKEYSRTGGFVLWKFYVRRILRIWPLYFGVVLSSYLIHYILVRYFPGSIDSQTQLPSITSFIFFYQNYDLIKNQPTYYYFLIFLWFISVEEQFYLVWGLVMRYLRPYMVWIACLLFISVVVSELFFNANYHFYDSRRYVPDYSLGALSAYICFFRKPLFQSMVRIRKAWLVIIYGLIASYFCCYPFLQSVPFTNKIIFISNSVIFSFIIIEQCYAQHSFFKVGKFRWLNYVGKLNYGLYVWHGVVLTLMNIVIARYYLNQSVFVAYFLIPVIALGTTAAIAILSFEFFEKKFLLLKKKFY